MRVGDRSRALIEIQKGWCGPPASGSVAGCLLLEIGMGEVKVGEKGRDCTLGE